MLGIMQNTMQLDSSYYTNRKKRKASEAFNDDNFDYLYGIVSTGEIFLFATFWSRFLLTLLTLTFSMLATDWYFTMYTPDKIYYTKTDYHINLTEGILENDTELRR